MATNVNKKARGYIRGKALSQDFREAVCDDLIANGAPLGNIFFPQLHALANETADKYRITKFSVMKYWMQLCAEGNVKPKKKGGSTGKLCDQASALIELYVTEQPSITAKTVKQKLEITGIITPDEVSQITV